MIYLSRNNIALVLLGVSVFYVSCVDWANPYDDLSKAKITIVGGSLQNGDTVIADEDYTYSLIFAVELKEFIDSFSINVDSGKAVWTDSAVNVTNNTDSTVNVTNKMDNPITFFIRFIDSGDVNIKINTYYVDGEDKAKTISVYSKEIEDTNPPLITIIGGEGDSIIYADSIPFTLEIKIQDTENKLNINSLQINEGDFDLLFIPDSNTLKEVYGFKTFDEEDFNNLSIKLWIFAEDILQNSRTDTFWIYQDTADTQISIIIYEPGTDSSTTDMDSITVKGFIDGITKEGVFYYLFISVNDSLQSVMNIITKTSNRWQRDCKLEELWNSIVVYLYPTKEMDTPPLDTAVRAVNYEPVVYSRRRY